MEGRRGGERKKEFELSIKEGERRRKLKCSFEKDYFAGKELGNGVQYETLLQNT